MTTKEILEYWTEFTKYDPNQTSFNLFSKEYLYHKISKEMTSVMEYDPSGVIAVLYAKNFFMQFCKEIKVFIFDLWSDSGLDLSEEKKMWDIFVSEDVTVMEKWFLDAINAIVSKVIGAKQVGNRNLEKERTALFDSISSVTEELTQCKTSLYLKGGPIQKIQNFSTTIHVFDRLAECLLALEQAADGMYLCYIDCGGSADGYFGFFIKSNGTILSVSERVDEAFPGQHRTSRNGRWSENKKYNLFPYNFIFSFSDHDYLGYAKNHILDNNKTAFSNLEPEAYIPLILAMVMISNKFCGVDTSHMPVMLVDSLFQHNIDTALPGSRALVVPSNSKLAIANRDYAPNINTRDILNTEMAKKLSDAKRPYYERGTLETSENIFVKLYGQGFELDSSKLLLSDPHLKMLTEEGREKTHLLPNAEFVGSADRMELIAYMQGRQQLADYIREQMMTEYLAAGGAKGIEEWWLKAVQEHKNDMFNLCVQKYLCKKAGDTSTLSFISFVDDDEHISSIVYGAPYLLNSFWTNKNGKRNHNKFACPIIEEDPNETEHNPFAELDEQ